MKNKKSWKAAFATLCLAGVLGSAGMLAGCSSGGDASSNESASTSGTQQEQVAKQDQQADQAAATSEAESTESAASDTGSTPTQSAFGTMDDFETKTVSGSAYSTADLAANKLTMVNVWTTTCPYCIEEMPGLELLSQQLPEGVGLIGVCADGTYNLMTAQAILQQTGVTFPTLLDSDSLYDGLLQNIDGVPTTVFVDSQGNLVGQAQVGVPTQGTDEDVAQAYLALIESHLAELG